MITAADVDDVANQIRAQAGSAFGTFAMDSAFSLRITLADHSHIEASDMSLTGCLQKMIDQLNARKEGG
jgi:hypothetical protein